MNISSQHFNYFINLNERKMTTDFTGLENDISKCSVLIYLPMYLSPNHLSIGRVCILFGLIPSDHLILILQSSLVEILVPFLNSAS